MTIAMLVALYLLSELRVEGKASMTVLVVGSSGTSCVALTALISVIMLNRIQNEQQRQPSDLELPPNVRSQRRFTTSDVDEGTIVLTRI